MINNLDELQEQMKKRNKERKEYAKEFEKATQEDKIKELFHRQCDLRDGLNALTEFCKIINEDVKKINTALHTLNVGIGKVSDIFKGEL